MEEVFVSVKEYSLRSSIGTCDSARSLLLRRRAELAKEVAPQRLLSSRVCFSLGGSFEEKFSWRVSFVCRG